MRIKNLQKSIALTAVCFKFWKLNKISERKIVNIFLTIDITYMF